MASPPHPTEISSGFLHMQMLQAKIRAEVTLLQAAIGKLEQSMLFQHEFHATVHAHTANYTTDSIPTKTTHGAQGANSTDTSFIDITTTTTVSDGSDHANACNSAAFTVNKCASITSTSTGIEIQSTLIPTLSMALCLRFDLDNKLFALSSLLSGIKPLSRPPGILAFSASKIYPRPKPPPEPDPTKYAHYLLLFDPPTSVTPTITTVQQ